MQNHICPYLGNQEDPQTAFEYPANGNRCYKARPRGRIKLEHQKNVCLQAGHVACPVYAQRNPGRLPAAIAAPRTRSLPAVVRVMLVALAVALFTMGFALTGGLGRTLAMLGFGPAAIPVTGQHEITATPFRAVATYTVPMSPMGGLMFEFTQSPNPTFEACPQPGGWTVYVVKPTDSLLRLSMIYALPVEALQAANCMGTRTTIRPGDRLYVPVLPTTTQWPTATPTRVVIVQPPVQAPPTEAPEPDPPDPPAPTQTPAPTDPPPTETVAPVVQSPQNTERNDESHPTDKHHRDSKPSDESKPPKEDRPNNPGPPDDKGPPDNVGPPDDPGPPDDKGPPDNVGPPERGRGNSPDRERNPGRGRPPDRGNAPNRP